MKKCLEFTNKNRYNTQQDADTAILLSNNKDIYSYHCLSCDGWHLASNKK